MAAELLLCSSVRRWGAGDKGAEEEEGTVGGKKSKFTPVPIFIPQD
jgi:hypothetical protein